MLVFRQIYLISSEFDNYIQGIDSFFRSVYSPNKHSKNTRPVDYTSIFEFRAAFFSVAITLINLFCDPYGGPECLLQPDLQGKNPKGQGQRKNIDHISIEAINQIC